MYTKCLKKSQELRVLTRLRFEGATVETAVQLGSKKVLLEYILSLHTFNDCLKLKPGKEKGCTEQKD